MRLGLIGGVSPFAYTKIYNCVCKKFREKHGIFPMITSVSIPAPLEMEDEFLVAEPSEITLQRIEAMLNDAFTILKSARVEAVGLCCNTLTDIFLRVGKQFAFKKMFTPYMLLNETVEWNNKILLLGTGYTYQKLYGKTLPICISDLNLIKEYLTSNINGEFLHENGLDAVIDKYYDKVESIVLACTDIDKKCISNRYHKKIIDSNSLFINACLDILE